MIDPSKWKIVATRNATLASGLGEAEIRRRICSGTKRIKQIDDYIAGQRTFVEEDRHGARWIVTFKNRMEPEGPRKQCFVVGVSR